MDPKAGFDGGPFAETLAPPPTPIPPLSAAQKAARRKEILASIENGTLDADTGLNALQALSDETK